MIRESTGPVKGFLFIYIMSFKGFNTLLLRFSDKGVRHCISKRQLSQPSRLLKGLLLAEALTDSTYKVLLSAKFSNETDLEVRQPLLSPKQQNPTVTSIQGLGQALRKNAQQSESRLSPPTKPQWRKFPSW